MNQAELNTYKNEMIELAIAELDKAIAYRSEIGKTGFFGSVVTADSVIDYIHRSTMQLKIYLRRSDDDWQVVHADALSEVY